MFSHICRHAVNWSSVEKMNFIHILSQNTASVEVSFNQIMKNIFSQLPLVLSSHADSFRLISQVLRSLENICEISASTPLPVLLDNLQNTLSTVFIGIIISLEENTSNNNCLQ